MRNFIPSPTLPMMPAPSSQTRIENQVLSLLGLCNQIATDVFVRHVRPQTTFCKVCALLRIHARRQEGINLVLVSNWHRRPLTEGLICLFFLVPTFFRKQCVHTWCLDLGFTLGVVLKQGGSKLVRRWSKMRNGFAVMVSCNVVFDNLEQRVQSLERSFCETVVMFGLRIWSTFCVAHAISRMPLKFNPNELGKNREPFQKVQNGFRESLHCVFSSPSTKSLPKFF